MKSNDESDRWADIPGHELVERGLSDLRSGKLSEEALLVLIASPRLERLKIAVPKVDGAVKPYEHSLYDVLERRLGPGAHSHYNSLLRRLVSFERAIERTGISN